MPNTRPFDTSPANQPGTRARRLLPWGAMAGFMAAIFSVLVIAAVSFVALQSREKTAENVTRSISFMEQLRLVLSRVQDAETGQRGYLLTGAERYLDPYLRAKSLMDADIARALMLAEGNPMQQQRIERLKQVVANKMEELQQTIAMRAAGDAAGAMSIVQSDRGKVVMDLLREVVTAGIRDEQVLLSQRQEEWRDAVAFSSQVQLGGAAVLLLLIVLSAMLASRDYRIRETQIWVRAGQTGLSVRVQGEQRLEVLGEAVLNFLAEYLGAPVGALYLSEPDGRLRRIAAFASATSLQEVSADDGLLGQAAKDRRPMRVRNVPAGHLAVQSGSGRSDPRELLIAPAVSEGVVQAVIELGFFRAVDAADEELLARVSEMLAIAVRSSRDRTRLEELLEETQRQGEELQAQQEELRVNNEELEEQGRTLKASQAQLESQQAELEQTNAHLEEQTQILENQKEELEQSRNEIEGKASELERANQYKSDFLANMSHELRTPLNSTLILAKLLADNKDGNLTPEQVKFAQTISGAGNDLLALINDILDLSKIEAGKVEVQAETTPIAQLVRALAEGFQPEAGQRGLQLRAEVAPGTPAQIETDAQRLGQILKNLLSNALKFTERGEIVLRVAPASGGGVLFEVRDTGIGIAAHQQSQIFEAFRQADGSTHRKYGGTGLGLSISRDLARLLGGDIALQSELGRGSTFSMELPAVYVARGTPPPQHQASRSMSVPSAPQVAAPSRAAQVPPLPAGGSGGASSALGAGAFEDDRAHLQPGGRLILVIEDDVRFAEILRDLAREMRFQCVAVQTANDGLAAAIAFKPSAILLDVNLPDHSGLGVLDQLKRDSRTRHIPVHVLSVADYAHEALERGAVGYDLKPVKKAQLVQALNRLEDKFSQGMRRVLVVEDDARQRESIRQLLGSDEVAIIGVESAGAALSELRRSTFDCMIMDLNLPDLSGYELLKQMSEQEGTSFPPVIVYTGRSLTGEEEQQLRRFSKSIIIKDARSPERLLDEVTLFLHQVESRLPPEMQRMLQLARDRDATLEARRVLVVEDDVRNIFALTSVLEPRGAKVELARNGREALQALKKSREAGGQAIDLVLMDIMMPEMDGLTAMREIRKDPHWKKLPIIALTAKAMKDDQETCLAAGANDYIAKPLDVEKLLSLIRVWMPK
jgi:CheY-like chemotaxis protein/signal transduction histidine kinase/CHASE3 domain sensor protein